LRYHPPFICPYTKDDIWSWGSDAVASNSEIGRELTADAAVDGVIPRELASPETMQRRQMKLYKRSLSMKRWGFVF
jgi:hypothetical protein